MPKSMEFRLSLAGSYRMQGCFLWSRAPVVYVNFQQIIDKGMKMDNLQDLITFNILPAGTLSMFPS
jgi:hypothetical protein